MSKYNLTINEQQAKVIADALELYSRVGMGQLEAVADHPDIQKRVYKSSTLTFPDARDLFKPAKQTIFGYSENGSYGITNFEINDCNRVAYDMVKVIMHRLSWDHAGNPPERDWKTMLGWHYDTPYANSVQPLAIMQRVQDDDDGE